MCEYILNIGDKTEYYRREGEVFYQKLSEKNGYSKPLTVKKLLGSMRQRDSHEQNREVTEEEVATVIEKYPHLERFENNIYKSFYLRSMILLLTAIKADDKVTADLILGEYHLSEKQIEKNRITHADTVECYGHMFGRLLFRLKNKTETSVRFYHNPGEDIIENQEGYLRLISKEVADQIDNVQNEYMRYLNEALDEEDGFCRCECKEYVFSFRETKISQSACCRNYLECVMAERRKVNGNWIMYHSNYGTSEVEEVVGVCNSISTYYGSYSVPVAFEKYRIEKDLADKICEFLPDKDSEKISHLPHYVGKIILYGFENNRRRLALKALYMRGLACRAECDELSKGDHRKRFVLEHDIYGVENFKLVSVDRKNTRNSIFRIRRVFYDINMEIDGRRYSGQYIMYYEKTDLPHYTVNVLSDHKWETIRVTDELDNMLKEACENFDKQNGK